ncbi:bactofilin family protein [Trichlorobacter ammonificans]|uniref:Bactofilin n=1 Tax=Trichlorobacter ammonificans TaxID=2916410 RepID=A0ABM9D8D3_9BACT|nr:polymer-forming cytoskeletal protein [Trichlorobacter ammonificans]CAH2031458.1 Bactofilin [Trichlorobacter ammonificans]
MFSSKQPKLEIIIGQESAVKGDIISKGTVRIDGGLEGNITADCVIIGEKGVITGDAVVRQMVVGGRMVGTIRASETVEIQRTGDVRGDLFSTRLSIADGGRFEGRSSMHASKEIGYRGGVVEAA